MIVKKLDGYDIGGRVQEKNPKKLSYKKHILFYSHNSFPFTYLYNLYIYPHSDTILYKTFATSNYHFYHLSYLVVTYILLFL